MKHTIVASALLAGLGVGVSTLPSAALPVPAQFGASTGHADLVQQARISRRSRMRMRQGSASRGNAAMPSRGAAGQQYGGTSGGPRR